MRVNGCLSFTIASLVCLAGCADPERFEDRRYEAPVAGEMDAAAPPIRDGAPNVSDRDDAGMIAEPDIECLPAVSSDALRPRASVMRARTSQSTPAFFTQDLFSLFRSHCGGCHVDNSIGGLQVTLQTFAEKITSKALERIRSDRPDFVMPPKSPPFSTREPNDPLVELADLLQAWIDAGSPAGAFYPSTSGDGDDGASPYLLGEELALQMTNLGNCIPDKRMIGQEHDESDALDRLFEKASELPKHLKDTDLVTLDGKELARRGVIAFAPAYTLWADNAKKIRQLRVPRGESIAFDEETQRFSIPANTRFYKTFLKHVVDENGQDSYRKIETRLILSRPDKELPDGTFESQALFGTYIWNESETQAELLEDPLRNGLPFRDHLLTVVTDEKTAEDVIRSGPDDLQAALAEAGATRTYAVPGSERCKQCHMGAVDGSFVLGFTPLQLMRRPLGEGGVIEPAERDELNQLQRLIDYGVISGMASTDDVALLEDSQGERKPRNEHELIAQGYMLGNCAHCHNPRGYPSRIAPELRDLLDFYPEPGSGIFQFPLERFSPRIFRGENRDVPIPYITPSLYDRATSNVGVKVVTMQQTDETGKPLTRPLHAPWRSLIYRNTDAPFSYAEDSAIFPHMPMNTASYDCRTRQIFGTWMTSIPARWKAEATLIDGFREVQEDTAPQPYEEILPDDPDFKRFERYAKVRVKDFQDSLRYTDCPDPALDIVDPAVTSGTQVVPKRTFYTVEDEGGEEIGFVQLPVPERPHWAITDLTDPPGDWNPRRPDWSEVLVEGQPQDPAVQLALDTLASADIRLDGALRALALTDVPFGVWRQKPACDFSGTPKLSDFSGAERPAWMDLTDADPSSAVYAISPGAQVFTAICANCHGPLADSTGRLAATIADMTGGQTRVANLRDGIFGPVEDPGANRQRIFGIETGTDLSADDWAARYMLWMGLGGTQRVIPPAALAVVGSTFVVGEKRQGNLGGLTAISANMLTVARFLCSEVLPLDTKSFDLARGVIDHGSMSTRSSLITKNGDAEMWQRLCTFDNAPPVRMVTANVDGAMGTISDAKIFYVDVPDVGRQYPLFIPASYPNDQPVGDQHGEVTIGIQPGNDAPWCIKRPEAATDATIVEQYWADTLGRASAVPFCPEAQLQRYGEDDVTRWAIRGAMNAGLSVFLYLDALARGHKERVVAYDRCEDRK